MAMYLEISRRKTKLCQNGETEPEIAPAFVTVTQQGERVEAEDRGRLGRDY